MTNGEKIKEIFPNFDVEDKTEYFGRVRNLDDHFIKADIDWWNAEYKEPTTKNNLIHNLCDSCTIIGCIFQSGIVRTKCAFYMPPHVEYINRAELLKAMDTWDKFGNDPNEGLIPLRTPALQDRYVPYVKYDDMVNCVKGMSSVTPQEPKTGHWEYGYAFADGNYCKCSECKEIIKCIYPMHYCPNCGTKMVEPQESEVKK
jgi:hypothetical protein